MQHEHISNHPEHKKDVFFLCAFLRFNSLILKVPLGYLKGHNQSWCILGCDSKQISFEVLTQCCIMLLIFVCQVPTFVMHHILSCLESHLLACIKQEH